MAVTRISDLVIPENFGPYIQQITEEKSRLVRAGVLVPSQYLNDFLAGGGLTTNVPSFQDLDGESRISNDDPTDSIPEDGTGAAPNSHLKIQTSQEIAVRMSRNSSWTAMRLGAALAGADPMAAIASRLGDWWARDLQRSFVAAVQGVFNENVAGADDMSVDISGVYTPGVTDFSLEALIDTATTMGDSADQLGLVMMHSHVMARAQKNNLVDFIPDTENPAAGIVRFIRGGQYRVILDDGMPNPAGSGAAATAAGVYHTWVFGPGAFLLGQGTPRDNLAVEVERKASSGNGGGQDYLFSRTERTIHPVGYAWVAAGTANGGPANGDAATPGTLAHEDSWSRVYPERKQIKMARLITTES